MFSWRRVAAKGLLARRHPRRARRVFSSRGVIVSLATLDGNHATVRQLAQHLSRAARVLDDLGDPPYQCDRQQRQAHRQRMAQAVANELQRCRAEIDRILGRQE
jgi:hypothetical protein